LMPQGTCGRAVAYAAIFSSTIQPTDQPTNFDLFATDFSVTVVQNFDPELSSNKKKGPKNDSVYYWARGVQLLPKTPFF